MNILGIYGSVGWDGNILQHLLFMGHGSGTLRVHGAGATLIMNGDLKTSLHEERFSRVKYDGRYPKLSIEKILDHNKLTNNDIDLVVYVGSAPLLSHGLKHSGFIREKLLEYFPNSKVEFVSHHTAHTAATFYTSGFDEANILTFDGAGDHEVLKSGRMHLPHMKFSHGKDLKLIQLFSEGCDEAPMHTGFGILYNKYSLAAYKNKMNLQFKKHNPNLSETTPGKIMGLAAYGDHNNINLPEWYTLEKERRRYTNTEWVECFPQLHNNKTEQEQLITVDWTEISSEEQLGQEEYKRRKDISNLNPDDLAAWGQHQFEKYLLLFLSNIPKHLKHDNLCLGGGCALNILANTKILEEGIYKNVHVNTAPNDDGLHFGAAVHKAIEHENGVSLPDDIGYLGIPYTDEDIESALV